MAGRERTSAGDPARTLELLWGVAPTPKRGPKQALSVGAVTDAAIALADELGLEALSMRKVAERLGVGTMSLYTYVPSKPELLDLMVDAVAGEVLRAQDAARDARAGEPTDRASEPADDDWRERLRLVARANWDVYHRHPWVLGIATSRPVLGPNTLEKYDRELTALEGIGLSDLDQDAALTLVLSHVSAAARSSTDALLAEQRTGVSELDWWNAVSPVLERVVEPGAYPVADRVGLAAGEAHQSAAAPDHGLAFGLERIIDGIAALIDTP